MSSTPLFPVSPLERVREGMAVVDEHGRRLGRVASVFMGYPDAVAPTTQDDRGPVGLVIAPLENTGGTTSIGAVVPYVVRRIQNDSEIPDELRLNLLRAGFIELDAPGLRGPARYIHGDEIREVADDVVRVKRTRQPS
jgi:hypothetical protein